MKCCSNFEIKNIDKILKKPIVLCLLGTFIALPLTSCKKSVSNEKTSCTEYIINSEYIDNKDAYFVYEPYSHRVEISIPIDISNYTSEDFLTDELYYKILDENYEIPDYYELSLNEEKVFPNGNYEPICNEYVYVFYNIEEIISDAYKNDEAKKSDTKFGELTTNLDTTNYIRVLALKK